MKWHENWIQVFKSGTHRDSAGNERTWTNDDLDLIVKNFSEQVPVVLGHPKTDEPAYAWVCEVKREGDILFAKIDKVHPEFSNWVEKGLYRKISIALDADLNLRHIGFLGAVNPAVKGLENNFSVFESCSLISDSSQNAKNTPFGTSDKSAPVESASQTPTSLTSSFTQAKAQRFNLGFTSEKASSSTQAKAQRFNLGFTSDKCLKGDKNMFKTPTKTEFSEKIEELERELAFAKKINVDKDFDTLLDNLQKESKITAEDKEHLSDVLQALYSGNLGQFSQENETAENLVAFLQNLPKRCEFSELATNENAPKGTYRTPQEELGHKIASSLR